MATHLSCCSTAEVLFEAKKITIYSKRKVFKNVFSAPLSNTLLIGLLNIDISIACLSLIKVLLKCDYKWRGSQRIFQSIDSVFHKNVHEQQPVHVIRNRSTWFQKPVHVRQTDSVFITPPFFYRNTITKLIFVGYYNHDGFLVCYFCIWKTWNKSTLIKNGGK